MTPIVSICCITYNHAPFIRQCLNGFLMQRPPSGIPEDAKMSDWCEILIHDDCSTDGTDAIIREYAEKYPDLIFPLYEEENQYSKGVKVDFFNYNRARGKYIAYCEGDDYWTDPLKLQKQVDFMEAHPAYSVCFHACEVYDVRTNKQYIEPKNNPSKESQLGTDVTTEMFLKRQFGAQPLTMLFRLSMFNFEWRNMYKGYRDTHEIYHLLKAGNGYFMNFYGGVHIKHNGGVATSVSLLKSCQEEREHNIELYLNNCEDMGLKRNLIEVLLWNYDVYKTRHLENDFRKIWRNIFHQVPDIALQVQWIIFKRQLRHCVNL